MTIPEGFKPPWDGYVQYQPSSPSSLIWVQQVGRGGSLRYPGNIAGSISKFGPTAKYWRIGLNGTTYFNHRVIWEMFNGPIDKGLIINHIDNNHLNNDISNLELVTPKENQHKSYQHNGLGLNQNNKSGILGVSDHCKIVNGVAYRYAQAQFRDVNGNKIQKYFKYQDDESKKLAFELAKQWRKENILKLIEQGAAFYNKEEL